MKVKKNHLYVGWDVSDGYISGRRTHTTKIPLSEINDCDTVADIQDLITDYIQGDFEQKVTWSFDTEAAGVAIADKIAPEGWAHRQPECDLEDGVVRLN
jgi:hypothetical protein